MEMDDMGWNIPQLGCVPLPKKCSVNVKHLLKHLLKYPISAMISDRACISVVNIGQLGFPHPTASPKG
jgi:hypothetical protein